MASVVARAAVEALQPERVQPEAFAPAVAGCVDSGGRFLHLCDQPDGELMALCDAGDGIRAWRTTPSREPGRTVPRPSACGVAAALHAEAALDGAGVQWATPAPAVEVYGGGVFSFPLGPVRADVAESAAWRLLVMGDEVLGLRLRFGYKRRDIERAMALAGPVGGVRLAERVTGTSPVAHALAYSRAWEAAAGVQIPPAAVFWRSILAELERLHSHLGDLGSLANATGLPVAAAELWLLKEEVLQACADFFGHRYLRGTVVPGGLAGEPAAATAGDLRTRLQRLPRRFGDIVRALDASGSFLDRLHGAGRVPAEVAGQLRPVGPIGRACGLPYDVRLDRPYGGYIGRAPQRVVESRADSWARYRVRVGEIEASLAWLASALGDHVPGRAVSRSVRFEDRPDAGSEPAVHLSRVEAPRGELIYVLQAGGGDGRSWVRLRPPSAANWAVVPFAVAENSVLQDVPIIDASFALSVSAMDR